MEKSATVIKLKKSTLFVFKSKKGRDKNNTTDPTNTTGTSLTTGIIGAL